MRKASDRKLDIASDDQSAATAMPAATLANFEIRTMNGHALQAAFGAVVASPRPMVVVADTADKVCGEHPGKQRSEGGESSAGEPAVKLDDGPERCPGVVPHRIGRLDRHSEGEEADDGDDACAVGLVSS